ncbi:MAG: hypothetical protein KN64_07550 [Sulfurovum sp. AS07-7]|nr:MAG: hypothetical protein KN64_07550 [Sulfurovum sp. AS07-7]
MKATKKVTPKFVGEILMVSKPAIKPTVLEPIKETKKLSLDFTYEYLAKHIEGFNTFDYDIIKPHLQTLDFETFFGIAHLGKKVQEDLSHITDLLVEVATNLSYESIFTTSKKRFWEKVDYNDEFDEINKRVKQLYEKLAQNKTLLDSIAVKIENNLKNIQKYNEIIKFLIQEALNRAVATQEELNQNLTLNERRFSLSSSFTIALHTKQNIENLLSNNETEMKLYEKYLNIIKPSLDNLRILNQKRFIEKIKLMLKFK